MSSLFPELDVYERLDPNTEDDGTPHYSAATLALFEQLDGLTEIGDEVEPDESGPEQADANREPEPERLYQQQDVRLFRPGLAAGAESIARFEQAFGLVGKLRSLRRTEGDAIEFVAEVDAQGKLAAGVLTRPGERAWRQGKTFNLSYFGGELHPVIAKALMRFMARYDGAPYELILSQIVPDPGDEHMLVNDYAESVFYAYAPSCGWRRFFEGTELYRGACGGHTGNVAIIDHADIECVFNQAPADDRLPNFFNTPAVEDPERWDPDDPREAPTGPIQLFTDIGDVDVIKGADRLVDEALNLIASMPNKPDSVVIQAGCLPEVTGDDIDASSARTRDRLRLPVIAVGQHNDVAGASLGDMLESSEFALDRKLDSRSVTILGMPAFVGRTELKELLRDAGINVRAFVFPEVPDEAVKDLAESSVLVEYPWDRYEPTIERLARLLAPARRLRLRPPYGLEHTRRWLLAIGAAVDRRAEVEAQLSKRLATIEPRWQLLRRRARQLRVGFVIDHGNWRSALSARRSLGLPMLELISEMGFGVEILAYAGERRTTPATEQFDDIRVRWYRTVDELDELLADAKVAAWYSELYFDRRLTRNGKASFSMRQFSLGLTGALDALEGMLRLANMSFYRSYASYLGPAFLERTAKSAGAAHE